MIRSSRREIQTFKVTLQENPNKVDRIVNYLNQITKAKVEEENMNITSLVIKANQMKKKQGLIKLVEKKVEDMVKEAKELKEQCKLLYDMKFPHFFYRNGDRYQKDILMNNLNSLKED